MQIVDGNSGYIPSAVSLGGDARHLINPGQKLSAEEAVNTIDVVIHNHMDLFGSGFGYFFGIAVCLIFIRHVVKLLGSKIL